MILKTHNFSAALSEYLGGDVQRFRFERTRKRPSGYYEYVIKQQSHWGNIRTVITVYADTVKEALKQINEFRKEDDSRYV